MSKRHNRKRTRSRPRHRDTGKARALQNARAESLDILSPYSTFHPTFPFSLAAVDSWHPTYSSLAWHSRLRLEQEQRALEAHRLRIFGGEAGDEVSLFEPMLKVVTDLFDGNIDYVDP